MDNPCAFPAGWPEAGYEPHYGMTLRDWFAGQALTVLCAMDAGNMHDVVRLAYRTADAMLAERERTTT